MEDIFLKGELVSLRKPNIEKDIVLGDWHQWFNDYEVTKYLVHGIFPNDRGSQMKVIEAELKKSNTLLLSIISNNTKKMIGVISLKFIDLLNSNAEIGMVLGFDKEHGAGLEAMALITEHGFDRLNLLKIYAGTNAALWKFANTLETIGYKTEGLRKNMGIRNGTPFDILFIAIDKDDYYKLKEERNGHLIDSMEKLYASKSRKNPVPDLKDFFASLYNS